MLLPVLAAAGAAALAAIVAVPIALGLWLRHPWPGLGFGAVLALAMAGALEAAIGDGVASWLLANAVAGLPVVVAACWLALRRLPPGSLAIATVSGLGPSARARFVILPLILPGLLGGCGAVLLAVLAEIAAAR